MRTLTNLCRDVIVLPSLYPTHEQTIGILIMFVIKTVLQKNVRMSFPLNNDVNTTRSNFQILLRLDETAPTFSAKTANFRPGARSANAYLPNITAKKRNQLKFDVCVFDIKFRIKRVSNDLFFVLYTHSLQT